VRNSYLTSQESRPGTEVLLNRLQALVSRSSVRLLAVASRPWHSLEAEIMSVIEMSHKISWGKLATSARTAFISKGTAVAPACSVLAPPAPHRAGAGKRNSFEYFYFVKCSFPCNMKHLLQG